MCQLLISATISLSVTYTNRKLSVSESIIKRYYRCNAGSRKKKPDSFKDT